MCAACLCWEGDWADEFVGEVSCPFHFETDPARRIPEQDADKGARVLVELTLLSILGYFKAPSQGMTASVCLLFSSISYVPPHILSGS